MVCVSTVFSIESGRAMYPRDHCKEKVKLYQATSTFLILSLIKSNKAIHKISRQYMASISIRNLTRYIDTIAHSNFEPRSDKWSG